MALSPKGTVMDHSPVAKKRDMRLAIISEKEKNSKEVQVQDKTVSKRRKRDGWALPPIPPRIAKQPRERSSRFPAISERTTQLLGRDEGPQTTFVDRIPSQNTLHDQLQDCQNERRLLQDQTSALKSNANSMELRLEQRRNEAALSARALRKYIAGVKMYEDAVDSYDSEIMKCVQAKAMAEAKSKILERNLALSLRKGADCLAKLESLAAEFNSLKCGNTKPAEQSPKS